MEKKTTEVKEMGIKKIKLTKGEIVQELDLLRSLKAWFTLSKDGALAFMKDIASFGKVTKEVEDTIKVYIDAIRTEEFITKTKTIEDIKHKPLEEQTDEEKASVQEFEEAIKRLDKEVNDLKNSLLAESTSIEIFCLSFDDFYEIMKQEQNKEVNGYGYEVLYKTFVN